MQFGTSGACCLVSGETGSVNYQLAQQLHAQVFSDAGRGYSEGLRDRFLPWSPRGQGLESQERGLFGTTGSSHVRGVIDGLDGGTLMIEDAECLHPDIQLRLATILERGFMDYGQSGRRVPVRLRLILSSAKCNSAELITSVFCRKLSGEVARKRMDLRSLRDRQTDLIAIAWYFMEMVIRYMPDISCRSFSPPAMEKIFAYPWPGNLPEMRQCISEACFRAQGREILADDLVLPSLSI